MEVLMAIGYILAVVVGFVLLIKGADLFVDGAAGIAEKLHVSSLVIGLTIVAVGTSTPEAAVSVIGGIKAVMGDTEAASVIMGNVLGSNMINILLILGLCALIARIPVAKSSRYFEIPFLIIISLLFILVGDIGNGFTWYDGLILIGLYIVFMVYNIIMAKRTAQPALLEAGAVTVVSSEQKTVRQGLGGLMDRISLRYAELKQKTWFLIVITIVGLGIVVLGAQLVVDGATYIAQDLFKIPTSIVAITVVAFGTSLPELVTSVSAARKGDMGIATGNIIGSNIANLLLIAGLGFVSSGAAGVPFDPSSLADGYMSIVAAAALLIFSFFRDNKLGKAAGITFMVLLVAYYAYRICATMGLCPMIEIPTLFN